jgi:hypothetical protein
MHHQRYYDDEPQLPGSRSPYDIDFAADGMQPMTDGASAQEVHETVPPPQSPIIEIDLESTVRSRLLNKQNPDAESNAGSIFSHPGVHRNYGSFAGSVHSVNSFGGAFPGDNSSIEGDAPDATHALLGDAVADGVLKTSNGQKKSTTRWLAERHGVKNQRMMYEANAKGSTCANIFQVPPVLYPHSKLDTTI